MNRTSIPAGASIAPDRLDPFCDRALAAAGGAALQHMCDCMLRCPCAVYVMPLKDSTFGTTFLSLQGTGKLVQGHLKVLCSR